MMLYDYPKYYEIAFSFRDVVAETAFLQNCIKTFSAIPVQVILEIACGPAPHAGELTARGYQYVGFDINSKMLQYARSKWKKLVPAPVFIDGDMVNFRFNRKVDFAYIMLGSLYINNMTELSSHFDSLAKVLKPGGLYFLDWCIQFGNPLEYKDNNNYTIEKDGISIESKFDIKLLDPINHSYEEIWTVNVNDRGRSQRFKMVEYNKAILPHEFIDFIQSRSDFEFISWWKDWDLNQPIITPEDIVRPVALVRRTIT